MATPAEMVVAAYSGFEIARGGKVPNVISRKTPPATPVMVASIMIPTISDLCSIAFRAPVMANAAVPTRSRDCMSS